MQNAEKVSAMQWTGSDCGGSFFAQSDLPALWRQRRSSVVTREAGLSNRWGQATLPIFCWAWLICVEDAERWRREFWQVENEAYREHEV